MLSSREPIHLLSVLLVRVSLSLQFSSLPSDDPTGDPGSVRTQNLSPVVLRTKDPKGHEGEKEQLGGLFGGSGLHLTHSETLNIELVRIELCVTDQVVSVNKRNDRRVT